MLKPLEATSMAKMWIVLFRNVSSQHVPQLGESKPAMAGAPPMWGKFGSEVKFGNAAGGGCGRER